jgi:hypothetical protein
VDEGNIDEGGMQTLRCSVDAAPVEIRFDCENKNEGGGDETRRERAPFRAISVSAGANCTVVLTHDGRVLSCSWGWEASDLESEHGGDRATRQQPLHPPVHAWREVELGVNTQCNPTAVAVYAGGTDIGSAALWSTS